MLNIRSAGTTGNLQAQVSLNLIVCKSIEPWAASLAKQSNVGLLAVLHKTS